jgi:translocation and assembly module TamB
MRKIGRVALRVLAAVVVLLIVCAIAGVLVERSGWFREMVRRRIITEIEDATGGRVELGSFTYDWAHLSASVAPMVLHGKEPEGEPPLLRIQSITAGLRIISMLERKVDLSSLRVARPMVRIVFYPDGSTNVPSPRVRRGNKTWAEDLLNLAVRRYEVVDGIVEYDDRMVPFSVRGEDLRARMAYDASGPRYRGDFASRRLRVMPGGFAPIEVDASAAFILSKSGIEFTRLHLATKESRADLTGTLTDVRAPHGTLVIKATAAVRDAVAMFQLPLAPAGTAAFDGKLTVAFAKPFAFAMNGRLTARGIGYARDRLKIEGAELRAEMNLTPSKVTLRAITGAALGGTVTGQAELAEWRQFHFDGSLAGLDVQQAAKIATSRPFPWNGTIAGGFTVDAKPGEPTAKVQASLAITPGQGGTPLEGQLDVFYDQAGGKVRLGNSYLGTPVSRLDLTGTLGEVLQVRARSSDLSDLVPALALASADAPKELPIQLNNGSATLNGTVTGPLDDPLFAGQISIANATIDGHFFDRFNGDVEAASRHGVRFTRLVVARAATELEGSAEILPRDGKFEDAMIMARLNLRNAQLAELAKEAGVATPISGTASAGIRLSGSVQRPEAEITVAAERPAALGEQLDRLRANLRYSPGVLEFRAGEADDGPGKLRFQGSYRHRGDDWKNGDLQFDLAAEGLPAMRVESFANLHSGVEATVDAKAGGTARVLNGELALTSVNGEMRARDVTLDREPLGEISLTAQTRGVELGIRATGTARDAAIEAQGAWRLEDDYPGSATIRVPRASLATLHDLVMIGSKPEQKTEPPFQGFVAGGVTVSVALRKIQDFRAELRIETFEVNPKPAQTLRLGVEARDIVLKNSQPVLVAISSKEARIRSAQFSGRDTSIEVTGGMPFDARTGADLAVRGSANLIILQLFNPDLVARGNATVQASIRGSLRDPQLNGRLELKNASLYLGDLPNGVDNANGAVVFDRNRATIEKLTAETGGGTVNLTGFVEFRSNLVYRLRMDAQHVRVRYPEDVSVSFSATLSLNGVSDSSSLSGIVTLDRASFTPRADLAQILAQAAKPVPAPAVSSQYLRGMQFDVRVESSPNFELQTSLTRNVEAEIEVRLRGTPLQPVLLGTSSINQGEIQVFGNRYTVNRGDIRFLNPVKIEPSFDMDLETRARGVTINVTLSGTLQKLNVNYSSDPPMQSREIIALLAVGRAPSESPGLIPAQAPSGSSGLVEAGGSLLGEAVSAQLSSRVQRFFGASRVKIDPTVTGVDYLPQARLTIEQQVSKDITLTYVTNLNRTQEQIVRIEWDVSRQWSAIAVREANGLFGIDLQYRKRFK